MVDYITTKQLKELLTSFKVDIPEDPLNESFVREILSEHLLKKLVFEITSLSTEVCFTRDFSKITEDVPSLEVCAVEVDVVCDKDELTVITKV